MRIIVLISLFFLFGCTSPKIVAELERADELMNSQPDSAFAIIKNINPDDIHGRADRAFYALLYTQAQYKNYDTIQSDSLIDVAVDYYENKPLKDRLTRAYMYKAAALSDMERHKEAIEWLKKAETVADTSAYLTLGLINSHIGELYQLNFVANDEHINKYKKALNYYQVAKHKIFENYTLNSIGRLYRISNLDSSFHYLKRGIELSNELNDSVMLINNMWMLAKAYMMNCDFINGKDLSIMTLNLTSKPDLRLLCGLGTAYAKLKMLDSAKYYFNKIETVVSSSDSVAYFSAVADIAVAKGDYSLAYDAKIKSTEISDRVILNSRKNDLYAAEKQYDNSIVRDKAQKLQIQNTLKNYLLVIVIIVLLATICIAYMIIRRRASVLKERILLVEQLKTEIDCQYERLIVLEHQKAEYTEKEIVLKNTIANRVLIIKKLANIKYEFGANPETFLRKFDEIVLDNTNIESDTNQIIAIANGLNNGIIDFIAAKEPHLTNRDLLILSMTCLKFKHLEMCIYLKSPSLDATYMLRKRLAKKLKIKSLDDYLTQIAEKYNLSN